MNLGILRGEKPGSTSVLLSAMVGLTFAILPVGLIGVLIKPLNASFGWSRGMISASLIFGSISMLLLAPIVGPLIDRYGSRRVALPGLAAVGLAMVLIGCSGPSPWTWWGAWLFYGVVQTCANNLVWSKSIILWFDRNRGAALGVLMTVPILCLGLVPSAAIAIMSVWSWRAVFFILAGLIWFFALPLLWFFFERGSEPAEARARSANTGRIPFDWSMTRTPAFWTLAFAFVAVAMAAGTLFVHMQPVFIDQGLTAAGAAFAVGMFGPSSAVSRLGTGFLLDRWSARKIGAVAIALPAASYLLILLFPGDAGAAVACALILGMAVGCESDVLAYIISRQFPESAFSSAYALLLGMYGIGYSVAPLIAGMVFDLTGTYYGVFVAMMAATLTGAAALMTLKPPAAAAGPV